MPSRREHDALEKALLGRITGISAEMDRPARWLGKGHRRLFHDRRYVAVIAASRGVEAATAAALHIAADRDPRIAAIATVLADNEKGRVKRKR